MIIDKKLSMGVVECDASTGTKYGADVLDLGVHEDAFGGTLASNKIFNKHSFVAIKLLTGKPVGTTTIKIYSDNNATPTTVVGEISLTSAEALALSVGDYLFNATLSKKIGRYVRFSVYATSSSSYTASGQIGHVGTSS